MASLIVHGDRNRAETSLPRQIHVVPVLGEADRFPPDRLIVDIIYTAVLAMREGPEPRWRGRHFTDRRMVGKSTDLRLQGASQPPAVQQAGTVRVDGAPSASEALTWAARFVPDRNERLVLLTWARCRATGESFRDRCREVGWSRSSAERTRQRALAQIVACLKSEQLGLDSGANRPGASPNAEGDLPPVEA